MNSNHNIRGLLTQLAGSASLCWEPKPTGVFDPKQAEIFVDQAETAINAYIEQALGKDEEYPTDGLAVDVDVRNQFRAELRQKFNLTKNGG